MDGAAALAARPVARRDARVDPSPAFAAGLQPRPIGETARDTLAWLESGEGPADVEAGLGRDKEQRILDAWLSKE